MAVPVPPNLRTVSIFVDGRIVRTLYVLTDNIPQGAPQTPLAYARVAGRRALSDDLLTLSQVERAEFMVDGEMVDVHAA